MHISNTMKEEAEKLQTAGAGTRTRVSGLPVQCSTTILQLLPVTLQLNLNLIQLDSLTRYHCIILFTRGELGGAGT